MHVRYLSCTRRAEGMKINLTVASKLVRLIQIFAFSGHLFPMLFANEEKKQ